MGDSSAVTAGVNATADQYNNLRTDAIKRDTVFVFEVEDTVPVQNEQGGHYLIPEDMTIYKISHKLEAGTATAVLKKNGSNTIESLSVTSSYTEQTASIDVTALTEGDRLQMDVTAASGATDLMVMLYATRNL